MNAVTIIQIIVIAILVYAIFRMTSSEKLCVNKSYGIVTNVPVSTLANANMGLVGHSSLGQAPLGDPQYWLAPRSPITQGQWGLYLNAPPLSEVQDFDPQKAWAPVAEQRQVYTQKPLTGQCTRLN